MKQIVTISLILLSFSLAAQRNFNVNIGASYQPVFFLNENPIQEYSLIPSVDIMIQKESTALRISLGSVSRVGLLFASSTGLVIGINYAYHSNNETLQQHAIEVQIGAAFYVGKNEGYLFSVGGKIGIMTNNSKFYYCPVSIGLLKTIE